MSYSFMPRHLEFPRLEIIDPYGNQSWYDLGSFSTGYAAIARPDTVRRKKPTDLKSPEALTAWGGHSRVYSAKAPVTVSKFFPWSGYTYVYHNADPANWATCGFTQTPYEPDWRTKLRLTVKDQKVNLAQSLAEYRQTQNMFVSNANAIGNALRAARRGWWKDAAKHLGLTPRQSRGTVSNRWLEMQYGWMPLIQDLHGSVEELQAALQRPRTRKVTCKVKSNDRVKIENYQDPYGNTTYIEEEWKYSVRVNAWLQQESLAAVRLGLANPIDLAWELLPYSFVIDWFIPIGDWLNSLDAGVGVTRIYGTATTRVYHIAINSWGSQYVRKEEYSRSVIDGLPSPPLPRWEPSVGYKRVANALSLLSQLKRELPEKRIDQWRKHYGSGRFFNKI